MAKRTHTLAFRPGDRVTDIVPGCVHGTFVGYCRGYLSHCTVQWDDMNGERRVKVDRLTLVERPIPHVD